MARKLMKGNYAAVYGAVLAGCEAYYGYPITPASEIAEAAAELFPKLGGHSSRPSAKPLRSTWSTAPRDAARES